MAKQGRERANGPYPHGRQFRVFYFNAQGVRSFEDYASEAEAVKDRDAYNAAAGSRTVSQALLEYLDEHASSRGRETMRYRLTAILQLREGDRPLMSLTAPLARELYTRRTKDVAVDTHRGELAYAVRFCDWCITRGWLRVNPFKEVKPIGKKQSREDQQLRVNEAWRVMEVALAEESLESLVVLMALLLGLRAHEVVERTVRDVDADGCVLWVPKSKTKAGKRQLVIPEVLRGQLLTLCHGKQPGDLIFVRDGKRPTPTRHWLHYHVVRLAEKAGVPRVTPHGLRRTWMTLGVLGEEMAGGHQTLADVARRGGHADRGATAKRHYIAPGAIETATTARVVVLLDRTKNTREPLARSEASTHVHREGNPYEPRSVVIESSDDVTNELSPEVN